MTKERRTARRCVLAIEITFDNLSSLFRAYTSDISKGGLFFCSEEELPSNRSLDFLLNLPTSDKKFRLQGRVVHSKKTGTQEKMLYGIGVEFLDISPEIKNEIETITKSVARQNGSKKTGPGASLPVIQIRYREEEESDELKEKKIVKQPMTFAPFSTDADFMEALSEWEHLAEGKSYYRYFRLQQNADLQEVRQAYYQFCSLFHPDLHRTGKALPVISRLENLFHKVTEAYKALKNPSKKKQHDRDIALQASSFVKRKHDERLQYEKQHPDKALQAKRLFELATESSAKQDVMSAKTNLKLAVSLNPFNPEYQKLLEEIEQQIQEEK